MRHFPLLVLTCAALLLAACGDSESSSDDKASTTATPAAQDLGAIKTYLLDHTKRLQADVDKLSENAKAYHDLAASSDFDNKELLAGTSLFLPVFVPGANFSCGDGHAVQGDGEVCLTALETCLKGTFEFALHKRKRLDMPRAITPTHLIGMGLDPDLDDAAKQALREMIRWLVDLKGWSSEEAYVFCSLACDLRVTQLVDGNKGIHAMVARKLLE